MTRQSRTCIATRDLYGHAAGLNKSPECVTIRWITTGARDSNHGAPLNVLIPLPLQHSHRQNTGACMRAYYRIDIRYI